MTVSLHKASFQQRQGKVEASIQNLLKKGVKEHITSSSCQVALSETSPTTHWVGTFTFKFMLSMISPINSKLSITVDTAIRID